MPSNLDRRQEIASPVRDPVLQAQVRAVLDTQLADTVKARVLLSDGRSTRPARGDRPGLRGGRPHDVTAAFQAG